MVVDAHASARCAPDRRGRMPCPSTPAERCAWSPRIATGGYLGRAELGQREAAADGRLDDSGPASAVVVS